MKKLKEQWSKYGGKAVTAAAGAFVMLAAIAPNICVYMLWGYEGDEEMPEHLKAKC